MDKNSRNILNAVYKTFKHQDFLKDDVWDYIERREPKQMSDVLREWIPSLSEFKFKDLPQLDHPFYGLLRQNARLSKKDEKRLISNTFQLLGFCLTTALACYIKNEYKPDEKEMLILIHLAVRMLEFEEENNINIICSFFSDQIFFDSYNIPEKIIKFAFDQLVLYWWVIPQKFKDNLFDVHKQFTPGLEGDFIQLAAETAKNIFHVGDRELGKSKPHLISKCNITSYHSVKGGTGKSTLALAHAFKLREKCNKGEFVAILDLDTLNPSLLCMGYFAQAQEQFSFLERILTSTKRPDKDMLKHAFERYDDEPILLGSVFGPGADRELLYTMLYGHIERWRIVVDNLRAVIEYLIEEKNCRHIILDNSPGFIGVTIPSAILAAEYNGTFVLVSTFDASDAGNIPLNQASFDSLFKNRRRVLVFNKIDEKNDKAKERMETYKQDDNKYMPFADAWQEAFSRAGLKNIVDISSKNKKYISKHILNYDEKNELYFFINIEKMVCARSLWDIGFVRISKLLSGFWLIDTSHKKKDMEIFLNDNEIKKFIKLIMP